MEIIEVLIDGLKVKINKNKLYLIYNYAVQKMCKKYPEITEELVRDLDGYELIKPGIFGKADGLKIHNKYWRTYG